MAADAAVTPPSVDVARILREVEALESNRKSFDGLWQDQADAIHPRRYLVGTREPANTAPDLQRVADAFDATAMRANRTLTYGQASRITPSGARWFALTPPAYLRGNPAAEAWFQKCTEILQGALFASNFYNRITEHYADRGAFGTAATEVNGGPNNRGLHFRALPIGTYSIAANSQDEVDTIAIAYKRTPAQIIQDWGEATPESVRTKYKEASTRFQPLDVIRYIFPRIDRDPRKSDPRNKPFASVHVLKADRVILGELGYDEFPVAVSRWETWGDSPYGWAPSVYALSDSNQANFLGMMLDTLAEVAAFPRVLIPYGMKGEIDFRANGITSFDPGAAESIPREWLTGGRYDIGKDRVDEKRQSIREAFFTELFEAIQELPGDATATQVRALLARDTEMFHPIFAGLTREGLIPILRRSFALLLRQGAFGQIPPAVIQRDGMGSFISDPEVEFTSPMALALEQSEIANFGDVINTLLPLAEMKPEVFDFIDTDAVGPLFLRYKGVSSQVILDPEKIAAIRQARAQQQQAAAAEQAAGAVQKLGGAPGIGALGALAGGGAQNPNDPATVGGPLAAA